MSLPKGVRACGARDTENLFREYRIRIADSHCFVKLISMYFMCPCDATVHSCYAFTWSPHRYWHCMFMSLQDSQLFEWYFEKMQFETISLCAHVFNLNLSKWFKRMIFTLGWTEMEFIPESTNSCTKHEQNALNQQFVCIYLLFELERLIKSSHKVRSIIQQSRQKVHIIK